MQIENGKRFYFIVRHDTERLNGHVRPTTRVWIFNRRQAQKYQTEQELLKALETGQITTAGHGLAITNEKDQFCRRTGLLIAAGRALKPMGLNLVYAQKKNRESNSKVGIYKLVRV